MALDKFTGYYLEQGIVWSLYDISKCLESSNHVVLRIDI